MLLYATVPGFYAEVERVANPGLAGRPVIVGGDPRKRGLVQSATPDALRVGVVVGMPMREALERCPQGRALRTDMPRYRKVASRLRACFRRLTQRVEPAGLDAAFLEPRRPEESASELAERLQASIHEELSLPLRVGIAPAKFLAKIAAEEAGITGILRIGPGEVASFLAPLPVSRLPGVGAKTEARLAELSVHRVGEVAALDRGVLEEHLGNHGLAILGYAQGRDDARLRAAAHSRSLSQEATLDADELDLAVIQERVEELARHLEAGLLLEHLAAKRVILKLRYADQEQTTRSRTLVRPVAAARDLAALAADLLARTQAGIRPVRLVGLGVAALIRWRRDDRQLDLFSSQS
jgi:nucleotidyltransferase/DNA polymerase involved in DNA repair